MVNQEQVNNHFRLLWIIIIFILFYKGKTLLAKAVANQTSATFLRVVGSELIQKYLVISWNLNENQFQQKIDFF